MLYLLIQNFQVTAPQLLLLMIGVKLRNSVLLRHYNERVLIHALKFVHHDFYLTVVYAAVFKICNICPILS